MSLTELVPDAVIEIVKPKLINVSIFTHIESYDELNQIAKVDGWIYIIKTNEGKSLFNKFIEGPEYIFKNSVGEFKIKKNNEEETCFTIGFDGSFEMETNAHMFPYDEQGFTFHFNDESIMVKEIYANLAPALRGIWYSPNRKINPANNVISIMSRRKVLYYTTNIFFPLFVIILFGFTIFYLSVNELSDRLGILITVLLTITAFKFVMNSLLSRTSKLTIIDYYVYVCYMVILSIVIECLCASSYSYEELDWLIGKSLGFVWMGSHMFLHALTTYFVRKWDKLEPKDNKPKEIGF